MGHVAFYRSALRKDPQESGARQGERATWSRGPRESLASVCFMVDAEESGVFIAELSFPHILFFHISLWLWLPKVDITDQEKQPPSHEGNSEEERGMHKP